MLLSPLLRLAAGMVFATGAIANHVPLPSVCLARADSLERADSSRVAGSRSPVGARRVLPDERAAPCAARRGCAVRPEMASLPLAQESTPRRSYGLLGLAIGAAAGYGVYRYQCSHGSDCYSPLGGVLLAAGGGVAGLVVGLLLSPDRSP